jgi:glycosyltransferase involved in cell wall biosynthesis
MRILSVTSQIPWPLNSGGHLRTFHIQKSLAQVFECGLIAPCRDHDRKSLEDLEREGIHVIPVPVPDRTAMQESIRLSRAWSTSSSYSLYGRHYYAAVAKKIDNCLDDKKPALAWLDHLDSFQYARHFNSAGVSIAIDLHNVYSLILKRLATEEKNSLKRLFLSREARLLREIEKRVCIGYHLLFAVSDEEAQHFKSLGAKHVHIVPNGTDTKKFAGSPTGRGTENPTVLFLGTMNWGPNVEAAKVLAEKIFPEIRNSLPNAKLLLVGKDPCAEILALQQRPGISVHANVPATLPYLEHSTVMAVPLLSGGGTRLKILEAMASGLPVVSTTVGAEGLEVTHGRNIILAEVDEMASAITSLASNPGQMHSMAGDARRLVCDVYDWERIGELCIAAVKQFVQASG